MLGPLAVLVVKSGVSLGGLSDGDRLLDDEERVAIEAQMAELRALLDSQDAAAIEQQTGVTLPGLAAALAGEHTVYATASGATLLTQPQDASGANMILSNALVAARGLAKDAGKPPFWHATSTKCRPHRSRT